MSNPQYFAATTGHAFERQRLDLFQCVYDAFSIRCLQALGVGPGWSCLEVAGGAGSMARWLADRIQPGGRVLTTDLNIRFLRDVARPHLEVRQHNILQDPLEHDSYDLVHCRALLVHLAEPRVAVERMTATLKRGGWIVIEEPDYFSLSAASPSHPLAEHFNRKTRELCDRLSRSGPFQPYFGRCTRELLEEQGLSEVGSEGATRIVRGGEPSAILQQMTNRALVDAGIYSDHELADLERAYDDPTFRFVSPTYFSAWGKRTG